MQTDKKWIWLADDIKIAGEYEVIDWKNLSDKFSKNINSDDNDWDKAFKIFETRVNTRFLNPIDTILGVYPDKGKGEGFSAVALQCILIEFFEAFYQGKIYAYKKDENLLPNEYNKSRDLFISFLEAHSPFSNFFNSTNKWANYFFKDVRCELLHEAATKDLVVIRTEKEQDKYKLIEKENNKIILYRTPFQYALKQHLKNYKIELMSSDVRKNAFKRKMDELCRIPTT